MLCYLIVLLIVVYILERCKPRNLVQLYQKTAVNIICLPGIGHAYKLYKNDEDFLKVCIDATKDTNENKYGIISFWMGYKLLVATANPLLAISIFRAAQDKTFLTRFMKPYTGNGSAFTSGDISYPRRKILAPTFATRHVVKFITIFEENAKVVVERINSRVGNGNFSAWYYFSGYALDSVCETVFGVKVDAQGQPGNPFSEAFQTVFKSVADRMVQPWLYWDPLYKLLPVYVRQQKAKKVLYDFADNIIQSKRNSTLREPSYIDKEEKSDNKSTDYKSFLELMFKSSKGSGKCYTSEELIEESLILLMAATDTSATGLCFALVCLSQHQDVQDQVYQEIQEVFGDTNKPIRYEDLLKLKYLDAVIKETLRMYPPIPLLIRDSENDIVLPSGITVPRTCDMIIVIIGIHRSFAIWGDDAEQFKPKRFLTGNIQNNAYMPFGFGPRTCPGHMYAILSLKTTLVTVLRKYRLLPATSFKYGKTNPLKVTFEIMARHLNNFEIQVEERIQ